MLPLSLTISSGLMQKGNNKIALGVITAWVPTIKKECEQLWNPESEDASLAREIKKWQDYSKSDLQSLPEIDLLRKTYQALNKNPREFLGSNEALLTRAAQRKEFSSINSVVDINNLLCFETRRSIGSYDLDNIGRSVDFRIGLPDENYTKVGGRSLRLENLPLFADEVSAFGSPTADSTRALISEKTQNLMMVIISFDGVTNLNLQLLRAQHLLTTYAMAKVYDQQILDVNRMSCTLHTAEKKPLPELPSASAPGKFSLFAPKPCVTVSSFLENISVQLSTPKLDLTALTFYLNSLDALVDVLVTNPHIHEIIWPSEHQRPQVCGEAKAYYTTIDTILKERRLNTVPVQDSSFSPR